MNDNDLMLDTNKGTIFALPETEDFRSSTNDQNEENLMLNIQHQSKQPVYEDIALRDTNKKVFSKGDPMKQAIFYAAPVHSSNEAGQFIERNTVIKKEADGKHYKCNPGPFVAKFNGEEGNSILFSIEKDAYKVAFSWLKTTKNCVKSNTPRVISAEDKKENPKVVYEGEDVNLIYEVDSCRVKENIEITQTAPSYRYTFAMDCEGLDFTVKEADRTIHFNSLETGKEIFMIPAPFMTDAAGAFSDAVFYEVRTLKSGQSILSVIADSTWINNAERVLPVTIDPQIVLSGSNNYTMYQWKAPDTMSTAGSTVLIGNNELCVSHRMYMDLTIPAIVGNPRIRKAELQVKQQSCQCGSGMAKIGLYQVTDELPTESPAYNDTLIDYADVTTGTPVYTFDLTSVFDSMYQGETLHTNLMLNLLDGNQTDRAILYSTLVGENAPQLIVTYENGYTVNVADGAAHELGWFGTGSVDFATGTLMVQNTDVTWNGNRMPVMIGHSFTGALSNKPYTNNPAIDLNTADFSNMKLGHGWRINWMQSMVPKTFLQDGQACSGYIYTDAFGQAFYFLERTETYMQKEIEINCETVTYALYTDTSRMGYAYDPMLRELYICAETYVFDADGRLIKVSDEAGNSQEIHYTSGKITSITDGAERAFTLDYNGFDELTAITAPDGTTISYSYTNGYLTGVTNQLGAYTAIEYTNGQIASVSLYNTPSSSAFDYQVQYTYDARGRVSAVEEIGTEVSAGQSTTFSYDVAARRTTAISTTEHMDTPETITTIYTLNDDGDLVGSYVQVGSDDAVQILSAENDINPYMDGVSYRSNADNLLLNHSFTSLTGWSTVQGNSCSLDVYVWSDQASALYGRTVLRMVEEQTAAGREGVYQITNVLSPGEYAFSTYIKLLTNITSTASNAGVYLRITDTSDNEIARSERFISMDDTYARLVVPFTLDTAQSVKVWICIQGKGTVLADAAQLEKNAFAGPYNCLINGSFERSNNGWTINSGTTSTTQSLIGSYALRMIGNPKYTRKASQTIPIKSYANVRESFTLSGWAKAPSLPTKVRENGNTAAFRLAAKLNYTDGTFEEFIADFSSSTDDWQYTSVPIVKSQYKTVQNLEVSCVYDYNAGTAYFDCIQLVRDNYETDLTAEDFVVDDGTGELDPTEPELETVFEEAVDAYGNNITETIFLENAYGTIYRSFGYNEDDPAVLGDNTGNDLVRITDERGQNIYYTVNDETSRVTAITDRRGNKMEYEYDMAGNVSKITARSSTGTEFGNLSYTYDKMGGLTQITRGDSLSYSINYNNHHKLSSVQMTGIGELVSYTYGAGGSRLKTVSMKDGTVTYVYNRFGQIVGETWMKDNVTTHRYKYVYNGDGQIVRCIDFLNLKEYTYLYENRKIFRLTENDITLDSYDNIASRTLSNTVLYKYNAKGQVNRRRVQYANGEHKEYVYSYADNTQMAATLPTGAVSKSGTDHLGRKTFDMIELGSGYLSRQFTYHSGQITPEHTQYGKVKSAPTTRLVDTITYSDGRTISYQYDAEQRITKVEDSVDGVTEYRYNVIGQLVFEIKNGVETQFHYDSYGNLSYKDGKPFAYISKDLLASYDGESIQYGPAEDRSPNPTLYRGLNLTWSKGRQLAAASGRGKTMAFTYNHMGLRTGKTVNGMEHKYVLEGTKILQDTYTGVDYLYDNEDKVCGMICGGVAYYFMKNLQDDIIAITNAAGNVIARYTYDAWGAHTVQGVAVMSGAYCTTAAFGEEIAQKNLFRYRSYVWDDDLRMYYLQSRYYDPQTGRFINADEVLSEGILGANLFAYCLNNPVCCYDSDGRSISAVIGGTYVTIELVQLTATTAKLIIGALVILGSLAILSSPAVQDAMVHVINVCGTRVKSKCEDLVKVIDVALDKAQTRVKNNNFANHHIVAQTAKDAKPARDVLESPRTGLNVNCPVNIVRIRQNLHFHLHTTAYYTAVNALILSAQWSRQAVVMQLDFIRAVLLAASAKTII